MAEMVYIVPASPDLKVPMPNSPTTYLSPDGQLVEYIIYWRRSVKRGDVRITTAPGS